jgi:hypothetical protein
VRKHTTAVTMTVSWKASTWRLGGGPRSGVVQGEEAGFGVEAAEAAAGEQGDADEGAEKADDGEQRAILAPR